MTDAELAALDLAVAKEICLNAQLYGHHCIIDFGKLSAREYHPTRDIAEAMRLAAERGFTVAFDNEYGCAEAYRTGDYEPYTAFENYADHSGDKLRACCVAICRAIVKSA